MVLTKQEIEKQIEAQIEMVKQDPMSIKNIPNPCYKVQLAAVKQNGMVLEFISSPFCSVPKEAVKQNWKSIQFIQDPDTEEQEIAVKQTTEAFNFIKKPVYSVLLNYLDVSEEKQVEAVKQSATNIKLIPNPCLKAQLEAVKGNQGDMIQHITNPSEEVQLKALEGNQGDIIQHITNPTKKVQLEAIKHNKSNIKHIQDPCLEVKEIVFESDPYNFIYIPYPTEKMRNKYNKLIGVNNQVN